MVACQVELGQFILYGQVVHGGLFGQLVAEAQAIIKKAETQQQCATLGSRLAQGQLQFVVVAAHVLILAPHGLPGLVGCGSLLSGQLKATGQRGFLHLQSQSAGGNHGLPLVTQLVGGHSVVQGKLHL